MNLQKRTGLKLTIDPDGKRMQTIVPATAGYMPNDLVFGGHGGLYFSDFRGFSTEPKGGAYYAAPDFTTITPVLPHLAMANGIALSPG
jgi:lactonase